MMRAKISIGLTVLCGACAAFAAPAFAEFESQAKGSDKGAGEVLQIKIHEGTNSIICEAEEEDTSKLAWTVEKGGKPVKNASGISVDIENWGKCNDKLGTEKFTTKMGECEIEMTQPGKEAEISGKIVKSCTIVIGETCEIKMISQQLKAFEVASNGGNEEKEEKEGKENNTGFSPHISNLTTEVVKSCGVLGIKGGKTATLNGVGQLKQARNGAPPLNFNRPTGTNGVFNEAGASNQTTPPIFKFLGPNGFTSFECEKGKFTGSIGTTPVSDIEVTPAYENCKETEMMGMPIATVSVSGCLYQYRLLGRPGGPNTPLFFGTMLLRGGLCEIKFATNAAPICKIIVKSQRPAHVAPTLRNDGTGLDIINNVGPWGFLVEVHNGCNGFTVDNTVGVLGIVQGGLKLERVNTQ